MALDAGVGRYRGFALIAIAMTGEPYPPVPPVETRQKLIDN